MPKGPMWSPAEDDAGREGGCEELRPLAHREETAAQRLLILAITWLRLAGIVQVLIVVAMILGSYPHPALVLVVAGIIAENAILLSLCWRRRAIKQSWVFADLLVRVAALVVAPGLARKG